MSMKTAMASVTTTSQARQQAKEWVFSKIAGKIMSMKITMASATTTIQAGQQAGEWALPEMDAAGTLLMQTAPASAIIWGQGKEGNIAEDAINKQVWICLLYTSRCV